MRHVDAVIVVCDASNPRGVADATAWLTLAQAVPHRMLVSNKWDTVDATTEHTVSTRGDWRALATTYSMLYSALSAKVNDSIIESWRLLLDAVLTSRQASHSQLDGL